MATREEIGLALQKAHEAGDTEHARILAKAYSEYQDARPQPTYDPTEGMTAADKVLSGIGSTLTDYGHGVGQMLGVVSADDVAEKRRLDRPLLGTTAGAVGSGIGHVAAALPTVILPGAATLKGAAAIGAGMGALQPAESAGEVIGNSVIGGGANAAGIGVGHLLKKGVDVGNAVVSPLVSDKGVKTVAANTIDRFADNPAAVRQALADALKNPEGLVSQTGAKPTLAEITKDRGIARLQDALRAADPQLENAIGGRLSDNMAARVESLNSLAGDSAKRESAIAARDAAAKPAYQEAFGKEIPVTPELSALLKRPSIAKAMGRAGNLAAEEGRAMGGTEGNITGQTLHDIKMGMDALLKDPNSGIAGAEISAVKQTRADLLKEIEAAIPSYKQARVAYASASKPINAMDIGEHLAKKASSNLSDLAGNKRLQANALAGMLKDPKKLIEQATGRKGMGGDLSKILSPEQMGLLTKVLSEGDTAAAVQAAGNGAGSATAQRLASANIMNQILPAKLANSGLLQTAIGKPLNMIYGGITEPKIQLELADLLINPENYKEFTNKQYANLLGRALGVGGMAYASERSK